MASTSAAPARSQPYPDLHGTTVGFIGLGDIGLPMVANLLRAQAQVWVNDLRQPALARAQELGARPGSLRELADHCPVICVAVINERQMRDVVLGAQGLLEHMRAGQTLIVHSTVPPRAVRELADAVRARRVQVLDAPMSGANIAARAGTLSFLVGGEATVLQACRPLLEAMGTHVFHLGAVGNGQVGKLVNGLIFHVGHVVILEALRLAHAHDVAEEDIVELVKASTGNCWTIEHWGYFDRFFDEHTLVGRDELIEGLLRKDIADALIAAHDVKSWLPMSGLAMELYPQLVYERQARRRAAAESAREGG